MSDVSVVIAGAKRTAIGSFLGQFTGVPTPKLGATHSQEPEWFTTAPVAAIQKVLDKAGWKVADVDLFEVNEAFAVVAMAPIKELGIPHDKLNVNGGAIALGHPIGASGCRVLVTLIHAMQQREARKGLATLCIGGARVLR